MNTTPEKKKRISYTITEVSQMTHITRNTLLKLIHDGKLKAINIATSCGTRPTWRIPVKSLNDFLEAA